MSKLHNLKVDGDSGSNSTEILSVVLPNGRIVSWMETVPQLCLYHILDFIRIYEAFAKERPVASPPNEDFALTLGYVLHLFASHWNTVSHPFPDNAQPPLAPVIGFAKRWCRGDAETRVLKAHRGFDWKTPGGAKLKCSPKVWQNLR